jgi:excisionase family DNA binding protein
VIVDVEACTAVRQAEVAAAKTMIERTRERFGLWPERLAADTGYGSAEMLAWLVHEQGIEPHIPVFDKEAASSLPELMSWIEIGMAEKTAEIRRLHGKIERLSNELETARKQSSPQRSEAKAADLKLAYTVEEVAEATSLSRGNIYRLCKAGRVKWIKIGERRLFLRCDLESFLKTAADNGGAA